MRKKQPKEPKQPEYYESSKTITIGEFEVNLLINPKFSELDLWGRI